MAALPPRKVTRITSVNSNLSGGPQKKAQAPKAAPRKPKCCDEPKVEDSGDGHLICTNCYTLVGESNIVADVTFQEDSRGAATVQGGFIADNARHAQTLGLAARRMGGGEKNNLQERERNGRRALSALCPRLGIPESVSNQAAQIFVLAAQFNFSAGRKTDEVVASCLFAACRRQKDNTVLLIDISELLQLNVFRLGEVYKEMCHKLYIEDHNVGYQHMVDIEALTLKYCRRLEFGDATRQVAEDAVKIMRRMKRDWMVTGRHPAGLCGACIILAARMNNFRRTTKEIVYVAKVADITIMKRVEEFRRTRSAGLTVDQFREYGPRLKHQADPPSIIDSQLKKQKMENKRKMREGLRPMGEGTPGQEGAQEGTPGHGDTSGQGIEIRNDLAEGSPGIPPAPTSDASATEQERNEGPPRKRVRFGPGDVTPASAQGGSQASASDGPSQNRLTDSQQQPRLDSDGFAIPAVPAQRPPMQIDPVLTGQTSQQQIEPTPPEPVKPKRGRPRGRPAKITSLDLSREEVEDEAQLERDIQEALMNDEVTESRDEHQKAKEEEDIARAEAASKEIAAKEMLNAEANTKLRRENEGVTWMNDAPGPHPTHPTPAPGDSAEDLEREFRDDIEVMRCLLPENERKLKESIWVQHNEDWLRAQHEKELFRAVAKAAGVPEKGPTKRGGKGKKGKGKTAPGTGETGTPINTPADANQALLDRRGGGNFSKYIDYDKLKRAYGPASSAGTSRAGSEAASQTGSGASTPAASPSPAPNTGMPSPPATQQPQPQQQQQQQQQDASADGEEEEDEAPHYDDDDENDYAYNSDEGDFDARQDGYDDDDFEAALDPTGGINLDGEDAFEDGGGEFE